MYSVCPAGLFCWCCSGVLVGLVMMVMMLNSGDAVGGVEHVLNEMFSVFVICSM